MTTNELEAGAHLDEETIVRYVQGHLDTELLTRWDRHLDACSPCRRLLAEVAKSGVLDSESFGDRTNVTAPEPIPTPSSGLFAVGEMVDHFKIIRTIGRGGMGEVFLARDTKLGRKVAVKVILKRYLHAPAIKERFMFEARATANFNHPHIVAIYGVGEVHDRPYVALEYLDGDSLRTRLNQERPSVWTTLRVALAIAEALAEAHSHEILHRDLKPENVLIPTDGRLRVVDFGLAQAISRDRDVSRVEHSAGLMTRRPTNIKPLPQEQAPGGTPAYMAPEQLRGEDVTSASDVWSLGVILYEMVTGHRPYGDGAGSRESLERDVLATAPVPTLEDVRALPTRIPALIYRCLAKQAARRPTAAEIADELRTLLAFRHTRIEAEPQPFRGLRAFGEDDAAWFFGRDAEINALVERVRVDPIVAVIGPSGVGKSSLVQAGLVPRLTDSGAWRILTVHPGPDPFGSIAAAIGNKKKAATSKGPDEDETKLIFDDGTVRGRVPLAVELSRIAQAERTRVLLVVDQLETLYTDVDDQKIRRDFVEELAHAADDPLGPVRVVFTLREDFLGRLALSRVASQILGRVVVVRSPSSEALHRAIEEPVLLAGHHFEDDDLPRRMVRDLGDEHSALPLLQLTAQQLWDRRDTKKKVLTHEAYRAIGGVAGALIRHADQVLDGLPTAQVALAKRILLGLVDETGQPVPVVRNDIVQSEDEGRVLDTLIEARLIRIQRVAELDRAELHLAHPGLYRAWPRLMRWVEDQCRPAVVVEVSPAPDLVRLRTRLSAAAIVVLSIFLLIAAIDRFQVGGELEESRHAWSIAERDAARSALERGERAEAAARLRVALEVDDDPESRRLWSTATGITIPDGVDHCAALRTVWGATPEVWKNGARHVEAPDHPCR